MGQRKHGKASGLVFSFSFSSSCSFRILLGKARDSSLTLGDVLNVPECAAESMHHERMAGGGESGVAPEGHQPKWTRTEQGGDRNGRTSEQRLPINERIRD
ncbi:hypothetical protein WR25_21190 [Diploscapter pachys]|uniref:Uncharacterized protein n=1 Tax=Diploscapter pachys TaxID=2018661 RepID=A0A2A2LD00_9BILA|nr:hypothetical protein WR25_21190 [Diploscapter pachys]